MSKLSDAVSELEAELESVKAERDTLKRQVERQKGAIEEGRGIVRSLEKQVREAGELIGTYQTHFHSFHGSAEHVAKQEKALAEAAAPPAPVIEQEPPARLMDRLGLVMKRTPTNGVAA